MTFGPATLTLNQILAPINVTPQKYFGFNWIYNIWDINKNVRLLRTDQRTDGPTNQPTNGRTNKTIHRDASQSLDASKKIEWTQKQKFLKKIVPGNLANRK